MKPNTFTLDLLEAHPQIAARTLEAFEPEELAGFLTELPPRISAAIVRELSPALAAACMSSCNAKQAAGIIQQLDADMAAMIVRRIDKEQRHALVNELPASSWVGLRMVLRYPEDTIGSIMDPNVLSVHREMPVTNVMKNMRLFKNQLLHAVYVTERNHVFAGALDVRDLFFANDQQLAGELMQRVDSSVTARTTLHSIYSDPGWSAHGEVPVVDHNRRFLGVVHQGSLNRALERYTQQKNRDTGLTETALALSELIWSTCAGIFGSAGGSYSRDPNKEGKSDDR